MDKKYDVFFENGEHEKVNGEPINGLREAICWMMVYASYDLHLSERTDEEIETYYDEKRKTWRTIVHKEDSQFSREYYVWATE